MAPTMHTRMHYLTTHMLQSFAPANPQMSTVECWMFNPTRHPSGRLSISPTHKPMPDLEPPFMPDLPVQTTV